MNENGSARPTVVVVGGGYAGTTVARALDEVADVTIVEPRDAFVHNIAALRSLVQPSWLPKMFFPYDGLLANGRTVRDRALRVEPGKVELASGATLVADYVVLATGSQYPFPAKTDVDDSEEVGARYADVHAALARAERVLVVGAGPVGLELTGELTAAWPNLHVALVDQADDILPGPFRPELRAELVRQLSSRNVELHLGSKLIAEPSSECGTFEPCEVRTEAGASIAADVWFRCYGVRPVSDYLAGSLADARQSDGFIAVTEHLNVPGHDTVFAIGDASAADTKMATRAGAQAAVVAANISAHIAGGSDRVAYEPLPPFILIPLGPLGGAAQLPGSDDIAGAEQASEMKGSHLMIARYEEMFGVQRAPA
jgi:NADH dehydrogenase FAD-containing subunit